MWHGLCICYYIQIMEASVNIFSLYMSRAFLSILDYVTGVVSYALLIKIATMVLFL